MGATRPSLDYLIASSQMSLESMELSRLNLASNLRKEVLQILEEWIDSEVDARLARSILEWRRAQASGTRGRSPAEVAPVYFEQLNSAFLPSSSETTGEQSGGEPYSQIQTSPARAERISQHLAHATQGECVSDQAANQTSYEDAERALDDSGTDATSADPGPTGSVSLARAAAKQDRGIDDLSQRRDREIHTVCPNSDPNGSPRRAGAARGLTPGPSSVFHSHHPYACRSAAS